MIGTRIESQPGIPFAAMFFIVVAAAIAVIAAINRNIHGGLLALWPGMVGLTLLLARPRRFAAELTDNGIDIDEPPLSLPYAALQGILMIGGSRQVRAPICLFYDGGVVVIPKRLNVLSSEVFAYLINHLSPSGSRDVPGALKAYCAEQEERFGPNRVFTYCARPHPVPKQRRGAIACCIGSILAGILWVVGGKLLAPNEAAWLIVGIILCVFAGLLLLAFLIERPRSSVRNWRQSGLVIGPVGLALIQGDMRGELDWDELRDVRLTTRSAFFEVRLSSESRPRGLDLVVAGAIITIADLYDRPLPMIRRQVLAYWQGEADE